MQTPDIVQDYSEGKLGSRSEFFEGFAFQFLGGPFFHGMGLIGSKIREVAFSSKFTKFVFFWT